MGGRRSSSVDARRPTASMLGDSCIMRKKPSAISPREHSTPSSVGTPVRRKKRPSLLCPAGDTAAVRERRGCCEGRESPPLPWSMTWPLHCGTCRCSRTTRCLTARDNRCRMSHGYSLIALAPSTMAWMRCRSLGDTRFVPAPISERPGHARGAMWSVSLGTRTLRGAAAIGRPAIGCPQ